MNFLVKKRPGQPKKFEDEELEALLGEDCCQTQEELAESLGFTQAAISKRLKAVGYIQKQGNWEMSFLHGIVLVIKNGSITTTPCAKNHI